VNLRAWERQK